MDGVFVDDSLGDKAGQITRAVVEAFQTALRQQRTARRPQCRSLDRLHLAAMEELGLRRLMTNNAAQAIGAMGLGFDVVRPGQP